MLFVCHVFGKSTKMASIANDQFQCVRYYNTLVEIIKVYLNNIQLEMDVFLSTTFYSAILYIILLLYILFYIIFSLFILLYTLFFIVFYIPLYYILFHSILLYSLYTIVFYSILFHSIQIFCGNLF